MLLAFVFAHQTVRAMVGLTTLANRDPHGTTTPCYVRLFLLVLSKPLALTSAAQAGETFGFVVILIVHVTNNLYTNQLVN